MIRQDYLIRMIQEIISLIVNAILDKKKFRKNEWTEYDDLTRQILGFPTELLLSMNTQEVIDRYEEDPSKMGKIELAAMTMLKISDEMGDDNLLRKSKLRQDGLALLKYVQAEGDSLSIQRVQLITMLELA
ncbi:hypothetical protein [Bacteroides sp. UBA939]|uniref:hypothetical protein n=1 Tax=Bacteroides sp. UBA939 TaxID=1946092 RepID=UPI0025BC65BE|nr:hypothetical protein [Bacteroides sp. UBA939]